MLTFIWYLVVSLNERFRADEQVERVRLEQRAAQFLYREDDILTFMDWKR